MKIIGIRPSNIKPTNKKENLNFTKININEIIENKDLFVCENCKKCELFANTFNIDKKIIINILNKIPKIIDENPSQLFSKLNYNAKKLNMDVDKIIQMAINEPTIFLTNSKDFINKVKLFQFQSQIKRVDYNERPEYYNINNEEVYKRIFTMLIKRHFGNFHISPQQVIEYIKSEPNEFYEFIIPQNEHNKKFIKFVEKTLEQNLGKVNARFIILEKNKY